MSLEKDPTTMDPSRQHAKEAVKLLKRKRLDMNLATSESQVVEMCTEIALGLEQGKLPDWFIVRPDAPKKTSRSNGQQTSRTPPSGTITPTERDDDKETTNNHSFSHDNLSPTAFSETHSTEASTGSRRGSSEILRSSPESHSRRSSSPVQLSQTPSGSLSSSPRDQRIPSAGLITTTSPRFSVELPPISTLYQRSLTGISLLDLKKKQSVKNTPKKKQNQEGKQTKKAFSKEQGYALNKSERMLQYWNIPFDPLREEVISNHNICGVRESHVEEEEKPQNQNDVVSDIDYWEIQKILRFVRIGNPTATVLALCALKEVDLSKPSCKEIINQLGGVSLLLNILDTQNHRCRVAALKVLVLIANSKKISDIILKKNGVQQLVSFLEENDKTVVSLACDLLWLLAKHDTIRIVANKLDIIKKLMAVFQTCVKTELKGENLTLCQSICYALWSSSHGIGEKDVTCVSESLSVISDLINSQKQPLIIPLLGLVEECASVENFRWKMEKENFHEKLMWKIAASVRIVQSLCVKILFKCASDKKCQTTLLKPNNLKLLMDLLKENSHDIHDELRILLLGIVWRCSLNQKHRKKFENVDIFPFLVEVLKSEKSLQVKSAALGVLSEFLWDEHYSEAVNTYDVINLLIDFLSFSESLVNCARCLGVCARDRSWRGIILQRDCLRLLWSLFKSLKDEVVISGAVTVASVCACPKESANDVRSIVGGVELLVSLLTNTDLAKYKVIISLCEAAVSIAKDTENLSILIDYGLISVIYRLCQSKDKIIRYYVTCLITRCCQAKNGRAMLSDCVRFLIEGLGDEYDEHVHCASVCALDEMSQDLSICASLRGASTTKTLLNLLGSSNERIQEAAAGCLANVRKSLTVPAPV